MVDTVLVLVSAACYSQQIAPAAARFSKSGDMEGIISLLRQGQQRLRAVPVDQHPFSIGGEILDPMQNALDILEGREFYRPATNHIPPKPGTRTSKADLKTYIASQVYALLFEAVCVAYEEGVPARQVLTRGGSCTTSMSIPPPWNAPLRGDWEESRFRSCPRWNYSQETT